MPRKTLMLFAATLVGGCLALVGQTSFADEGCVQCQNGNCSTCQDPGSGNCSACGNRGCGRCRGAGRCQGCGGLLGNGQRFCVQCRPYDYGHPDLFYNFYVAPACGGGGAQLYVSPQPVPASVGHTYITYQPLLPHEMLYAHQHYYHRYYNGGRGLTRTHVKYSVSPLTQMKGVFSSFKLAR